MGSPSESSRYDAMHDWVGLFIQKEVKKHFDTSKTILDVGAGWGKYYHLLPEYTMDACEIWKPNIVSERLNELYRKVYNNDICDLHIGWYDVVIMGDVFEHIKRPKAKELLEEIYDCCEQLYIAVPFNYHQDEVDGNPYEKHEQDDLTLELMAKEYPSLQLVAFMDGRGVYTKR